jgi:hypothetical protein
MDFRDTYILIHFSVFLRKLMHNRRLLDVPLDTYLDMKKFSFMYQLVNRQAPRYLCDRVQALRSANRTRNLMVPLCRTTHRAKSCFVQGVQKWNTVPINVKVSPNLASFRKSYLTHFGRTAGSVLFFFYI